MVNRRFTHSSNPTISALLTDQTDYYTWIGFEKDSSNICHLKRTYAFDLEQVYYDLELSVNEIKRMSLLSNDLYVAVDDSVNIVYKYNKNNPLSINSSWTIPVGIVESPVDIINDGTYVYVLIPGDASATNAKILQYETDGTLIETINLTTVTNASSLAIDSNDEIRVITYTDPVTFIRVYQLSGGVWVYDVI